VFDGRVASVVRPLFAGDQPLVHQLSAPFNAVNLLLHMVLWPSAKIDPSFMLECLTIASRAGAGNDNDFGRMAMIDAKRFLNAVFAEG
jgi:hypothetical protein